MKPEAVDAMLEHYRENKARCAYLEKTIEELKDILRSARSTMRADAANGVQVISGMPHGGGTSDPTGRYGLLFASGWMPEDMREIEAEVAMYEREYAYKIVPVTLVERILSGLTSKEHLLVYGKCVGGNTWRELADEYAKHYGIALTTLSLKRMYKTAKQKMYRIAE